MNTQELLHARLAELRAEVDAIKADIAPDRSRLDDLIAQQNALDAEIVQVTAQWRRRDAELIAKKQDIAAVAKALGAKSLSGK